MRLPDSCALSFAALPIVDNGQVEVYDAAQRCFFSGYLKDIDKSRVLVQFDSTDSKQSGPVKWFDWSVVREVPPVVKHPPLAEGHLVEVSYTDEGSNEKPAWWEAKIVQKKGPFYKVHFLCGSFPDEAVEEEKIRPATTSQSKGVGPLYTKQTVPVIDTEVHASFIANEAALMTSVREKSQLLAIHVDKKSPQLKLIGTAKSIAMGKMLLELHMKHHADLTKAHTDREMLASKLESAKAKRDTGVRIEFPVERELIGLVVGKGGKNILDAKKASGVDVVDVDQNGPSVVLIGPSQEAVEKARELLEFVIVRVPVRPEQIGWLIGKNGRNFKELQSKTLLTRLNVDKASNTVMLVGTQTAVSAAQLYIDTHLEYLAEFDKEEIAAEKLRRELQGVGIAEPMIYGANYSGKVGKGVGKGSGRGKGSGSGVDSDGRGRGGGKVGGNKGGAGGGMASVASGAQSSPATDAPLGRAPGGPKPAIGGKGGGVKPSVNGSTEEKSAAAATLKAGGGGQGKSKVLEAKEATPLKEGGAPKEVLPQREGKGRGRGSGDGKGKGRSGGGDGTTTKSVA